MANISITFYNCNNIPVETVSLIGAKQSKSWLRKTYGKDSDEVDNDYYFVKKKNKYGIKWVVQENGVGWHRTDFARDKGECMLPNYSHYNIVIA